LNGQSVYELNSFDDPVAASGEVEVQLPPGVSNVIVKASSGGAGWGFTLGIESEHELEDAWPGE
jgi:hypothetical protein